MADRILESFLESQKDEGLKLSNESELLDLFPIAPEDPAPDRYLARFRCKGLIRSPDTGEISVADSFDVGIRFPPDYLRHADAFQVVSWLSPVEIWHPNIAFPLCCVGHIRPGTTLIELIFQIHEIITYIKRTLTEGLNEDAAIWARKNLDRFPVDTRPLKRRAVELQFETVRKEDVTGE